MPVLNRATLTESPLADVHELAAEFGIEGFRKLRKPDLIGAILKSQGIEDEGPLPEPAPESEPEPDAGERAGAGRRARTGPARGRSRSERGARRERNGGEDSDRGEAPPREDKVVTGLVDLLGNGSGFVRIAGPGATDEDVYISAAQVRRCELVSGDTVSGPSRPARRSERYPSLVRVDTINGKPVDEVVAGTRFEDLAVTYPTERLELAGADKLLSDVDAVAPIGKGSRVTIAGAPHAGKSSLLRLYAEHLRESDFEKIFTVVVGVRPEEIADWGKDVEALTFAASPEAQSQAVFAAIDNARRIAARGADAVVLIDTLDGLSPGAAKRALGAARNIDGGGSLTVIATAAKPFGIETTIITLDVASARAGKSALDAGGSGTIAKDRLKAGKAVAKPRAKKAAPKAKKPAAKPRAKKPAAKKPAAK